MISSTTITFAAGETEFLFPVGTVADSVDEGEESFRAVLSGPVTGGASIGSASMATVFITDRKFASKLSLLRTFCVMNFLQHTLHIT